MGNEEATIDYFINNINTPKIDDNGTILYLQVCQTVGLKYRGSKHNPRTQNESFKLEWLILDNQCLQMLEKGLY